MRNNAIIVLAAAVGVISWSPLAAADTLIRTKDGRTYTLPIEPDEIRSINPSAATVGSAQPRDDNVAIAPPRRGEATSRSQSDRRTAATVKSAAVGLPAHQSETPGEFASFEARCNAPEVVFCDPLDSEGPWGIDASGKRRLMPNDDNTQGIPTERWWQKWRGVKNKHVGTVDGAVLPSIDTTVKTSGTGSLKFVVPPFSKASGGGAFTTNFSNDLSQTFGEGDTFFVQFRWRASCDLIYFDCNPNSPTYKTDRRFFSQRGGRTTAFKLSIVGNGDPAIGKSANSCTRLELVLVHSADHALTGYHNCGWFAGFTQRISSGVFDKQPGGVFSCPTKFGPANVKMQWGATSPSCFQLDSDRWVTLQMQTTIGTWQPRRGGPDKDIPPNSRIKVWAAYDGEPQQLVVDHELYLKGPGKEGRYGKIWLMPFMTRKDPTEDHPMGEVWYDELIVSRAFIANPE